MFKSGSAITRKMGSMVAVLAILGGATVQIQAQAEVKGVEATYNVTRADGQQTVRDGTYTFLEGEAGLLISAPMSGSPTNTFVEYIYFAGAEYFSEISRNTKGEMTAKLRNESMGFLRSQGLLRAILLDEIKDEYEPGTPLYHKQGVTKIVSDITKVEAGVNVRQIEAEYFRNANSRQASPVSIEIRWSEADRSDRVVSSPSGTDEEAVLYTFSEIRPPSDEVLAIYGSGGIPTGMEVSDIRIMDNQYRYVWAGEPQPFTGLTSDAKFWLTISALGGFVLIGSAWLIRNFFVRLDGASEA